MTTFIRYTNSKEIKQNQSVSTEFPSKNYLFQKKEEKKTIFKMIEKKDNKALIKFNVTKNEIFQLNENYKTVHRKLKLQYNVEL